MSFIKLESIPLLGRCYQEFLLPYYSNISTLRDLSESIRPFACRDGISSPRGNNFAEVYWIDNNRYIEIVFNLDTLGLQEEKMVLRHCDYSFIFEVYSNHQDELFLRVKDMYEFDMDLYKSVEYYKYSVHFYDFIKAIYRSEFFKLGIA